MAISLATQTQEEGALAFADMKASKQWVCYRKIPKKKQPGEFSKYPFNPTTGRMAEPDNSATWVTYEQAEAAYKRGEYDGIGFMFCGYMLPIMGIDFDHCVNPETGQIDAWAWEYIKRLNSFTEYSPSMTGAHVFIIGEMPAEQKDGKTIHPGRKREFKLSEFHDGRHERAAVEMYSEGRYFTVTGLQVAGLPAEIMPRQEQLQSIYDELFTKRTSTTVQPERRPSFGPMDLTDNELLDRAMQAQNGADFRRLWNGEIGSDADKSTADFLLCQHLAFWTGKDATRMDRLFRRSGLYRPKWDEKRGSSTYGELTINRAIQENRNVYSGTNSAALRVEKELERIFASPQNTSWDGDEWAKKSYHLEPKEIADKRVLECLDLNEWGDALLFAEAFEGTVLYDAIEKSWYLWAGQYWRKDQINQVKQLVSGHVGAIYIKVSAHLNTKVAELIAQIEAAGLVSEEADRLKSKRKDLETQMKALNERAKALRGAKRCMNVLNTFATSDDRITVTSEQWDSNPWLLGTQNGVINLKTGKCRDGRPEDFIRTVVPTTWKGLTEQCPRFLQFLEEIFQDRLPSTRVELIAFLKRLFGCAITGRTDEHIFPIFYGAEGRNGKDSLLAILKFVLGPLAGAISNDVLVASDKGRSGGTASPHLVDLQGKRLVWGSETKQGAIFNVAGIKLLTGGGEISARQLYGHQYTFVPTHTLFLITNYRPHADAKDKAFWARTCLIEFNTRFVDKPTGPNEFPADSRLKETLEAEASGILAWLVQGCLEWQEQGLNRPESVELATEQYRQSEDQLQVFLEEVCFTEDKNATIKASELYETYREWAKEGGMNAMNRMLFGIELSKKYEKRRVTEGICYLGIRLRKEGDPLPEPQTTISKEAPLSASTDTGEGEGGYRGYSGVSQEAQITSKYSAIGPNERSLLLQVEEVVSQRDSIFWRVPGSGFPNGFVSSKEYLSRLQTCLASGEDACVKSAREEIHERLDL